MVTLYSQPFKIFLILRYYGIYIADQLTRHNVTLCMGAPLVFINITHTLYYLKRMHEKVPL